MSLTRSGANARARETLENISTRQKAPHVADAVFPCTLHVQAGAERAFRGHDRAGADGRECDQPYRCGRAETHGYGRVASRALELACAGLACLK